VGEHFYRLCIMAIIVIMALGVLGVANNNLAKNGPILVSLELDSNYNR
jgi:hypothetical protein